MFVPVSQRRVWEPEHGRTDTAWELWGGKAWTKSSRTSWKSSSWTLTVGPCTHKDGLLVLKDCTRCSKDPVCWLKLIPFLHLHSTQVLIVTWSFWTVSFLQNKIYGLIWSISIINIRIHLEIEIYFSTSNKYVFDSLPISESRPKLMFLRGSRITQQLYIIVQWRILFGNQLSHDVYDWVPIVKWEHKTFANPDVDPQKSCLNKNAKSRSILSPSGQIGEYKISAQDSIEQTLANLLALSWSWLVFLNLVNSCLFYYMHLVACHPQSFIKWKACTINIWKFSFNIYVYIYCLDIWLIDFT